MEYAGYKIFPIVQLSYFNLSVITLKRRCVFLRKRCLMRVVWLSFANTIYIHLHTKANKHNDHLFNASLKSLKKISKIHNTCCEGDRV